MKSGGEKSGGEVDDDGKYGETESEEDLAEILFIEATRKHKAYDNAQCGEEYCDGEGLDDSLVSGFGVDKKINTLN